MSLSIQSLVCIVKDCVAELGFFPDKKAFPLDCDIIAWQVLRISQPK